jgi:hypothetical protein
MGILIQVGVASEAQLPYTASCVYPSAIKTFRLNDGRIIQPTNTDAIKSFIANRHPVAINMLITLGFEQWGHGANRSEVYAGQGYRQVLGGHAMLIVGYDDSRAAYRVMNSWGTSWGDRGYVWISYRYFESAGNGAVVCEQGANPNPDPQPGPVSFTSFDSVQYLSSSTGIYYIVHPFTLSEPVFVERGRLIDEENGGSTAWFPANMWMTTSYVWWSRGGSPFPPGRYSHELQGRTRDGRSVTVRGTQHLRDGGFVRNGKNSGRVEASRADIAAIRSLSPARTTDAVPQLTPGEEVIVNGHRMSIHSK